MKASGREGQTSTDEDREQRLLRADAVLEAVTELLPVCLAYVSADRRYVRLSLTPVFQTVTKVQTVPVVTNPVIPGTGVPALLPQARPLHEFVKIDLHLPGCPPKPNAILGVITNLIAGRITKPAEVKFG